MGITENLTIAIDPETRKDYLKKLQELDGLPNIVEDPKVAYCPISLTNTPLVLQPIIRKRQEQLIEVLGLSGISAYDPGSSPHSPDRNLETHPHVIYRDDSAAVLGARYFVGHELLPSTGVGVETEKAVRFNRVAVLLNDVNVRVSRMQPHRVIRLMYSDFENQSDEIVEVFKFLQQFEPGMGFNNGIPALLGFRGDEVVDLEQEVYRQFPDLQYKYNPDTPTAKLHIINPKIFLEARD